MLAAGLSLTVRPCDQPVLAVDHESEVVVGNDPGRPEPDSRIRHSDRMPCRKTPRAGIGVGTSMAPGPQARISLRREIGHELVRCGERIQIRMRGRRRIAGSAEIARDPLVVDPQVERRSPTAAAGDDLPGQGVRMHRQGGRWRAGSRQDGCP